MKPSLRCSKLHFIGIGGSGMSSMAEVFTAWGFRVTGSDQQASETTDRLRKLGIEVAVGHGAGNVGQADTVVYSSAVAAGNPEMLEAKMRGIPTIRRAEMLGEALRGKYSFGVAGTHGKTTTTTMLGRIWRTAGKDPTLLAGGTTRGENLSAVAGAGSLFIFEADEFDKSFLAMRPTAAIIGNIDSDHLDCYGNLAAIRAAFATFAASLPWYGLLVLNADDAGTAALLFSLPRPGPRIATYGFSTVAEYQAVDFRSVASGSIFTLEHKGIRLGEIALAVPGLHNAYNALAASVLSLEEGLTFKEVEQGLKAFQGVKCRLEFRGERGGVRFYDDYAHHPTEVAAALQAVRTLGTGRLVAVFQPHLYSRTQQLFRDFAAAFKMCDLLFVTRVFSAREARIPGVEGNLISDAAQAEFLTPSQVHYIEDPDTLPNRISPLLKAGDMVITMGAGDIGIRCASIMAALP